MRATATARERVAGAEEQVRNSLAVFIRDLSRETYDDLKPGKPMMILGGMGEITIGLGKVSRTATLDYEEGVGFTARYSSVVGDRRLTDREPTVLGNLVEAVSALRWWVQGATGPAHISGEVTRDAAS